MGHALDFDDTTYSYIGHVSVSVLPSALAAGERVNASGLQVLGAYIIGTEVACKLGAMVTPKLYEDGWHSTCIIGAFGATAAAGKLLGLTEDQMVHALAVTVSETSGVKGNIGTMSKPFQVGRSAENGVVAALLAKQGMTGASDIFEKGFGFCQTFKVGNGFGSFYSKIGNPYDMDLPGFYLKEFPSCSSTHPALNATIRLIQEHRIEPDQVQSVDCAATPLVVTSLMYPDPQDSVQARFSMQFCLTVALLGRGKVKVTDFQDNKVKHPKTIDMMKKIHLRISPELEKKGFAPKDGPEGAVVEITLKNGKRYSTYQAFADWRPDHMPSWEVLSEKYRDCASLVLPKGKVERSLDQIQRFEQIKTIGELMASITL
jgi:2-methylcitrate dehydratase PrpD